MSKYAKNVIWALVVAFFIFYLYTRPEAAANAVRSVFGIFDSLARFFNALAR